MVPGDRVMMRVMRTALFLLIAGLAACSTTTDPDDAPKSCDDVTCGANAACDPFSLTCTCRDGYEGDGTTCTDVDECAESPCDPHASCTNTPGGFACECDPGWESNGFICEAREDNLCATANGGCDPDAECTYTGPNERSCTCQPGFDGDGLLCTDFNECLVDRGGCDAHAVCRNLPGRHECVCFPGWQGDGTSCVDVDECAEGNGGCDPRATCTNLEGARVCTCPAGDQGDGLVCGPITWTGVDTAATVTCGVKSNGSLWCWGRNVCGQVGRPETGTHPTPFRVGLDLDWQRVATADEFACALKTDGSLWCWGCDGRETPHVPERVGSGTWDALEAGGDRACATQGGALWCWTRDAREPVRVGADTDWNLLAPAGTHLCGVKSDGALWCGSDTPVRVGSETWSAIATAPNRNCGVSEGRLHCWAQGEETAALTDSTDWLDVALGAGHGCARRLDETLWCWGDNAFGQVGDGTQTPRPAPVRIGDTTPWAEIHLGPNHACGLRGPQIACWGENANGQLGDGSTEPRFRPVVIAP